MKISTIEIQTITASENMLLTNGEAFSSVGGTVYLSCNDVPENWWEITLEEAKERWPEEFAEPEELFEEEVNI
jgi:hypothetical protein